MSKDSHFTGQPVYSQVLKLLDKEKKLILKFYQTVILPDFDTRFYPKLLVTDF